MWSEQKGNSKQRVPIDLSASAEEVGVATIRRDRDVCNH